MNQTLNLYPENPHTPWYQAIAYQSRRNNGKISEAAGLAHLESLNKKGKGERGVFREGPNSGKLSGMVLRHHHLLRGVVSNGGGVGFTVETGGQGLFLKSPTQSAGSG